MGINNNFKYSNTNKRYHTWDYYLKHKYNSKVYKIPLNANFTCPNRDGSKGIGGCTFCSSNGSSAFNLNDTLEEQYINSVNIMERKWPNSKKMVYFQSYTNSYDTLDNLKKLYDPYKDNKDIVGICIATRSDALDKEKINYFNSLSKYKDIWIELGLQTIHDNTSNYINRCSTFNEFKNTINLLKDTNINICVHIMNSLPNESEEMMLDTIKEVVKLPIHAIKIHMLHIIKNTKIAKQYENNEFNLLTREQYIDLIVKQLEYIPEEIIIQRLTGDGIIDELIAPLWSINKRTLLNDIDKRQVELDSYQGKLVGNQ